MSCGCNQPTNNPCYPSLLVPVDVQSSPSQNPSPLGSASECLSFHSALTGFVIPPTGGQSSIQVADGSLFAAGQWIQFVNPTGTFRVMSIAGNTLILSNAAADGVTPIAGNPTPPTQYGVNAQFVTVAQPSDLSPSQFSAMVQTALQGLSSVCLNEIPQRSNAEQSFLLQYVKSSLCPESDGGCCLRKAQDNDPYIDVDGKAIFSHPVQATAFNVPVPPGGIPSSNTTLINQNNGTGGGYLIPFVNPVTGLTTYIDLFSGASNDSDYVFHLSNTGALSMSLAAKERVYFPAKLIGQSGANGSIWTGVTDAAMDIASKIGESLPSWATHVRVRLTWNNRTDHNFSALYALNGSTIFELGWGENEDFYGFHEVVVPILPNGKLGVALSFLDSDTTGGSAGDDFKVDGTGRQLGFYKLEITGILRANG